MSVEALELENQLLTSSVGRNKKRLATTTTFNHPLLDFDTPPLISVNNNNNNNINNNNSTGKIRTQPSSRIR
jgi:hypothetical protein